MLEQLFNLIQSESQKEIIHNVAIPNEHNNHAVGLATDAIFSGLQNTLSMGGLQHVLGMFTGTENTSSSNPMVQGIVQNLTSCLQYKFGLETDKANNIAGSLVPNVLDKLVKKTNDPTNNGFNINGIIGALTGGGFSQHGGGVHIPGLKAHSNGDGGIDFGSILKNLRSGTIDSFLEGRLGIETLTNLVSKAAGGAQQIQPQSGVGVLNLL